MVIAHLHRRQPAVQLLLSVGAREDHELDEVELACSQKKTREVALIVRGRRCGDSAPFVSVPVLSRPIYFILLSASRAVLCLSSSECLVTAASVSLS